MFELKRGMKKSLFLLANTANNIKSLYTKVIYGGKKNKWRTIKVKRVYMFLLYSCVFRVFFRKNQRGTFFYVLSFNILRYGFRLWVHFK